MDNTKKCPNCGEWTKWNLSLTDTCEHCGEVLQKKEAKRAEERVKRELKQEKEFIFNVNENDNFLVKILKRGGYAIYLVVMAIVSFITWIAFWLGP